MNQEVLSAAKWQAERGHNGAIGTPLPSFMSTESVSWISSNQPAFRRWVKMWVKNMAIERSRQGAF